MKILIVDDEFNNRMLMQKLLSPYGSCDVVVDGQEALEAFILAHAEGEPYELICMDIMMPEMDGHQSVQAIREKEKELAVAPRDEVRILMVTALDSPKDVLRAYYQDGCTDYMVKPVTREKVEEKLREYGLGDVIDVFSGE
ncbi:MAG: response regulator [Magnetococcales bacterium]|nr:response regulator [Magnetococcales bacterium]NGZ26260.1 response regulator [Magnetococcales bacterium]